MLVPTSRLRVLLEPSTDPLRPRPGLSSLDSSRWGRRSAALGPARLGLRRPPEAAGPTAVDLPGPLARRRQELRTAGGPQICAVDPSGPGVEDGASLSAGIGPGRHKGLRAPPLGLPRVLHLLELMLALPSSRVLFPLFPV